MARNELEIPFRVFRWNPRWGDAAPIVVWIVLSAVLQISRLAAPRSDVVLEWLVPLADLGFILAPLLWLRLADRTNLGFLGISRRRIWWAVGLGVPLGILVAWLTLARSLMLGDYPFFSSILNTVVFILTSVFHLAATEFFYRGWVASRFEQSFGFFAGVICSGVLFAFSPLVLWGTDPNVAAGYSSLSYYWSVVFPFTLFSGILLAGIARLVRNLWAPFLIMLPQTILSGLLPGGASHRITSPVSSLIGILALSGIVVVVAWITKRPHGRKSPRGA